MQLSDDLLAGAAAAAAFCGLSRRAIYHLAEKERIPVIRKGRSLYFRRHDLAKAFAANTGPK